jgi:hypothetical protein
MCGLKWAQSVRGLKQILQIFLLFKITLSLRTKYSKYSVKTVYEEKINGTFNFNFLANMCMYVIHSWSP